jgi:hypothetical protein
MMLSLVQKVSMLVMGIALFVSIVIGGVGDLLLRRLATNLVEARLPSGVASVARIVDRGEAAVTAIMGADGSVVGAVIMRKNTGAAIIPALLVDQSLPQNVAATAVTLEEGSGLGAMRWVLFIVCILVFAAVTLVGMKIARDLIEPLIRLTKELDLLAKGDTTVKFSALERTDEIGQIARSAATVQESLGELARFKAAHGVTQPGAALRIWDGVQSWYGRAKELMVSEGRIVANGLSMLVPRSTATRFWQTWKASLTKKTTPNLPIAA